MIYLTRMDKQHFFVNPDHIVSVEETPDTVITLFNGHHFIVKESADDIIELIVAFRSSVIRRAKQYSDRKYLDKRRKSRFKSRTQNSSTPVLSGNGNQCCAPLHSVEL